MNNAEKRYLRRIKKEYRICLSEWKRSLYLGYAEKGAYLMRLIEKYRLEILTFEASVN